MNGLQRLASRFSVCLGLVSLVLAGGATFAMAQGRPTIAEKTEGMEGIDIARAGHRMCCNVYVTYT